MVYTKKERLKNLEKARSARKKCAKKAGFRFIDSFSFKKNNLPVQVSVVVPSTNKDKTISAKSYNKRIHDERRWFARRFGGDTSISQVGSYFSGNKLVNERNVKVESSMSVADYNKHKKDLESHFLKRRKEWNQDTLLVGVEGQHFIVPKRSYVGHDKKQGSKILVS